MAQIELGRAILLFTEGVALDMISIVGTNRLPRAVPRVVAGAAIALSGVAIFIALQAYGAITQTSYLDENMKAFFLAGIAWSASAGCVAGIARALDRSTFTFGSVLFDFFMVPLGMALVSLAPCGLGLLFAALASLYVLIHTFRSRVPDVKGATSYGGGGWHPEPVDSASDEERAEPEAESMAGDCPFAGTVRLRRELSLAGRTFGAGTDVFEIDSDWRVGIPGDSSWGWIDVRGAIHRAYLPAQRIDPNELDFGSVVAEIRMGNMCYAEGEHVGDLV